MGFIQGEARGQQTLFPSTLDDLIAGDHVCRVIEVFVGGWKWVSWVSCEPSRRKRAGRATIRAIC
jgi:hypothetical protein